MAAAPRGAGGRERLCRGDPRDTARRGAHGEGIATPVIEAPVRHDCPDCGTAFELSARNTRIHRNRGTSPKCDRFRYGARAPKVTEAHRRWWLERFTPEELQAMAAAVWG